MSSISTEELYLLGSGRVGTYVHRWDLLSNRDWGSLLMGSGLGSDWFRSYTWWLDPRVSHNLYFSVIIETGFIGLVGLLVLLAAIYLRLPPGRGKSFFYIIVLSGLISHGFVSDSQFRIMLFAAMALAVVAYREEISGAPRP
jgi:O-antigen ligase